MQNGAVAEEPDQPNAGDEHPNGGDIARPSPTPPPPSAPSAVKPLPPGPPSEIGEAFVGRFWIIFLALMLVGLAALVVVALIQLWPAGTGTNGSLLTNHVVIGIRANLNIDTNLMLIVLLSGALGGLLHSLRSISWYVGERRLKWSWVLFYACLPFVGAILALLFYLLIRGGLVSTQGTTKDLNPYGLAAIAGLVGLFSIQAVEMLKKVFSTIFTSAPSGSDTAPQTTSGSPAHK